MQLLLTIFLLMLAGSAAAQKKTHKSYVHPPPPPVVYMYVEQEPEFRMPGTYLGKYIREHLWYSREAYIESMPYKSERNGDCFLVTSYIPKNITTGGTIPVCLLVDTDGTLLEVTITKSLNPVLDKAVLQVLQNMPPWNPGKIKGVPVIRRVNIVVEVPPLPYHL